MVNFDAESLAIGNIFRYPNPLQRTELEEWASQKDWVIESGEVEFEGPGPSIVAEQPVVGRMDDRFVLVYNSESDLRHFGKSAYITVKDEEGGKAKELVDMCSELREFYSDIARLEQLATYEITLEGRGWISPEHSVSNLANSSIMESLSGIHGERADLTAARLTSDIVEEFENYFYLLIDSDTDNPGWWQVKYVRRYEHLDNFDKSAMLEDLYSTLDLLKEESE